MKDVITFVGIDAHKKDLFVAMLVGDQTTPVDVATGERAASGAALGAEARARAK
jgi:hypothetical protein